MDWEFIQTQIQSFRDGIMEHLDIALQQISDLIDSMYIKFDPPLADERRRLALLQAAATMRAQLKVPISLDRNSDWAAILVDDAEKMLEEIERRELQRAAIAKGVTG